MEHEILSWLPVIVFILGIIIAAAKIAYITKNLSEKIDQKVDTAIYKNDQSHVLRELDQIQSKLKIIDEKIDGLVSR